jgi:hypothetical protein
MKNFLLASALILFMLQSSAQGFVDPANQWNVMSTINFGGSATDIIKINGDSVVGSHSYKKIISSSDSLDTWNYLGLVREEANKVYYIRDGATGEGLLYDFNLGAGDTASIVSYSCPNPIIYQCSYTDSITNSGKRYKIIYFDSPFGEIWIDGVGSFYGPLNSGAADCMADLWFMLLCFHRNDVLLYMDETVTHCYINTVGISESVKESGLSLLPNPVIRGQMLLIKSDINVERIELYTMAGQKLISTEGASKIASVATVDLAPGMYCVKIFTNNHVVNNRKIIVY